MAPNEERALVERAKRDTVAFGALFEAHYLPIFGYVRNRVGDWSDAKDITAEVFLKAFKGLWRFRWQGVSFAAWLYRIASNEIAIYFRKGRRHSFSLDRLMEEAGFEPVDPCTIEAEKREAERQAQRHEEYRVLRSHIATLPMKYQEVIALRYFERKSVRQMSEIVGKPEGTVKSLLSRAVGRLKEVMINSATF